MQSGRVLVVEDDEKIGSLVRLYLEREGFDVSVTSDGETALSAFARVRPRLVVLDVGLPGIDGIDVCRAIRSQSSVPILMLTARDSEVDKVLGLEMGADDYVTKPFSPRELLARVRAVLRRVENAPAPELRQIRGYTVDRGRREVVYRGKAIDLTPKEFDLLWYLTVNEGLVLTRGQIMDEVWGYEFMGGTRTVDAHIRQLRKKLGDDFPIKTKWGVGYQLDP